MIRKLLTWLLEKLGGKAPTATASPVVPASIIDRRNDVSNKLEVINRIFVKNSAITKNSEMMYDTVESVMEHLVREIAPVTERIIYRFDGAILCLYDVEDVLGGPNMKHRVEFKTYYKTMYMKKNSESQEVIDLSIDPKNIKQEALTVSEVLEEYGIDAIYMVGTLGITLAPARLA